VRLYELPKTIPAVKMLLAPEELGSTNPLPLENVDFKSFKANGAIRSLSFSCPITIPKRSLQGF
jgi:hypothetical protein